MVSPDSAVDETVHVVMLTKIQGTPFAAVVLSFQPVTPSAVFAAASAVTLTKGWLLLSD